MLATNQTVGRPLPSNGAWSIGRAFVDPVTLNWRAFFAKDGLEWNASHLVGTSQFSVLGAYPQKPVDGQQSALFSTLSHSADITDHLRSLDCEVALIWSGTHMDLPQEVELLGDADTWLAT